MIAKTNAKALFKLPYVNLVGTKGKKVIVGVEMKMPEDKLESHHIVPKKIDGITTDVIETGVIKARYPCLPPSDLYVYPQALDRTDMWRPAPGGISIGHYAITAGTLGMAVMKDGQKMILSNNHVLANSNYAQIGDNILQPGPYDLDGNGDGCIFSEGVAGFFNAIYWTIGKVTKGLGLSPIGRPTTRFFTYDPAIEEEYLIGHLHSFHPIDFSKDGWNRADCALAKPIDPSFVRDDILDLGIPDCFGEVQVGDKVTKSGRTTAVTQGTVSMTDAWVKVSYGFGVANYEHQIITDNMVSGGDSGSILLSADKKTVVGLVFAGSDSVSIMNHIGDVREALGGFECLG